MKDCTQVGIRLVYGKFSFRYTVGLRDFFFLEYSWYTVLFSLVYVLRSLHTAWYTESFWFGLRAVYGVVLFSVYARIRWYTVMPWLMCRFGKIWYVTCGLVPPLHL